ncbi:MAG: AAA family ATPase [Thiotrichales bacterium]|nr:MAG: AAA family ATPase [Thiotrichales bacterium]
MHTSIVGRKEEISVLQSFVSSDQAEFLAIYGRRRIGKTFLIRTFFEEMENIIFFNATGTKDGTISEQIKHFTQNIGHSFFANIMPKLEKNWDETFAMLTNAINLIAPDKKIVIFLDELPWMATRKSKLLQSLDYHWNQYWSRNKHIKLIVCGSSASWIINKIINNKGGLHNRITKKIQLLPFDLADTKKFLKSKGINLNEEQITQIYMVTGGIPYYLTAVNKGQSAAQIIENLAFKQNSLLLGEFDNLFSSLFDDAAPYIELLEIISKSHYGLSQENIIKKSKLSTKGGRIKQRLKELKETGFILGFKPYKHKRKGVYYRIIDEYTLFYFHWLEPIKDSLHEMSLEKGYWLGIQNTPAWHSWTGYAFEAICYKHIHQIRKKLDIPVTSITTSWRYVPIKKSIEDGAQIDLLFDRSDGAITICEIKYSVKPFVINKQYAKNLLNKGAVFEKISRIKKQQFIAIIASNGIQTNLYSDDLISNVVTLKDLFR